MSFKDQNLKYLMMLQFSLISFIFSSTCIYFYTCLQLNKNLKTQQKLKIENIYLNDIILRMTQKTYKTRDEQWRYPKIKKSRLTSQQKKLKNQQSQLARRQCNKMYRVPIQQNQKMYFVQESQREIAKVLQELTFKNYKIQSEVGISQSQRKKIKLKKLKTMSRKVKLKFKCHKCYKKFTTIVGTCNIEFAYQMGQNGPLQEIWQCNQIKSIHKNIQSVQHKQKSTEKDDLSKQKNSNSQRNASQKIQNLQQNSNNTVLESKQSQVTELLNSIVQFRVTLYRMLCKKCNIYCQPKIYKSQLKAVTSSFILIISEILDSFKPSLSNINRNKLVDVHKHEADLCQACKYGTCHNVPNSIWNEMPFQKFQQKIKSLGGQLNEYELQTLEKSYKYMVRLVDRKVISSIEDYILSSYLIGQKVYDQVEFKSPNDLKVKRSVFKQPKSSKRYLNSNPYRGLF